MKTMHMEPKFSKPIQCINAQYGCINLCQYQPDNTSHPAGVYIKQNVGQHRQSIGDTLL